MMKKAMVAFVAIILIVHGGNIKQADAFDASVALDSVLNLSAHIDTVSANPILAITPKIMTKLAIVETISLADEVRLADKNANLLANDISEKPDTIKLDYHPSPTPTLVPTATPTPIVYHTDGPTTPTTNLNAEVIFSLINQHRAQIGLQAFSKDPRLCELAQVRSTEIGNEIWVTGALHSGLHAHNFPYKVNENIISMKSEGSAVSWWLNSWIHRRAIEGQYQYSCVSCSGNNCSEVFTNFEPK